VKSSSKAKPVAGGSLLPRSRLRDPQPRGPVYSPALAALSSGRPKPKGRRLYCYVVESARVNGKPRIVSQARAGAAERVAALVKDRTAPVPLAAIQRVCQSVPKTDVPVWRRRTILHSLRGFSPERFTPQAFWDCFDRIQAAGSGEDDPDRAQLRLPGLWKERKLVSQRLLAYDSTNFYTYIASANTRNQLAQPVSPRLRNLETAEFRGYVACPRNYL
jgi:hypothetical protein